jgi:hypothetical protein
VYRCAYVQSCRSVRWSIWQQDVEQVINIQKTQHRVWYKNINNAQIIFQCCTLEIYKQHKRSVYLCIFFNTISNCICSFNRLKLHGKLPITLRLVQNVYFWKYATATRLWKWYSLLALLLSCTNLFKNFSVFCTNHTCKQLSLWRKYIFAVSKITSTSHYCMVKMGKINCFGTNIFFFCCWELSFADVKYRPTSYDTLHNPEYFALLLSEAPFLK